MAKTNLVVQTELAWLWHNKAASALKPGQLVSLQLRINMAKDHIVGWPRERDKGRGWNFAKTTAYLATIAAHTTGTISLEQYSAAVGAGDTAPVFPAGSANRVLIASGGTEPYRILTYTDADNLVLATPYLGEDDDDASYSIVEDIKTLPAGFNGLVEDSFIIDGEVEPLIYVPDNRLNLDYARSVGIGVPNYYGFADRVASGSDIGKQQVWLRESYPETVMGITYKYYTTLDDMTADGDIPLFGYVQGGDNALIQTATWLFREADRDSFTTAEIEEARIDSERAINGLWQNDSKLTDDKPEQESMGPVFDHETRRR